MAAMVLADKAGKRVLLEPVQSGASTTGERDETKTLKPTEITWPNKHKISTSELYRLEKSVKNLTWGKCSVQSAYQNGVIVRSMESMVAHHPALGADWWKYSSSSLTNRVDKAEDRSN